jgi:hypothetical protein
LNVYGIESFLKKSGTVFCRRGERNRGVPIGGFIAVGVREELATGGGRIGGGIFFSGCDIS